MEVKLKPKPRTPPESALHREYGGVSLFVEKIKVPYSYLSYSGKESFLKEFLSMKQLFPNGRVYNYTVASMAYKLRSRGMMVDPNRLSRLIRLFKSREWVYMDGTTLVFASNKNKKCKSVPKDDLQYEIRKLLILQNFRQQEFAYTTKKNLKYPRGRFGYRDHKRAKSSVKKLSGDTSRFICTLMLSYQSMSELLGVSHTTAYNTMDRMIKEGILSKKTSQSYVRTEYGFLKRRPNSYFFDFSSADQSDPKRTPTDPERFFH